MFKNGFYYEIEQKKGVYEYRLWKNYNDGTPAIATGRKNTYSLAKKQVEKIINQKNEK